MKKPIKYLLLLIVVSFSLLILYKIGVDADNKSKVTTVPFIGSPTITISLPTITPTKQVSKKTTTGTKTNLVDCVGPDGVHFQTTQKECDEFNSAWGNSKKPTMAPSSSNSNNVNTAISNVKQSCLAACLLAAEICTSTCTTNASNSNMICNRDYSGEDLSKCEENTRNERQSCYDRCNSDHNAAIDRCLK
jgi:hypothetical protein